MEKGKLRGRDRGQRPLRKEAVFRGDWPVLGGRVSVLTSGSSWRPREVACIVIPISQVRKSRLTASFPRGAFRPQGLGSYPQPLLRLTSPRAGLSDQCCLPEGASAVPGCPDQAHGQTDGRALSTCVCCSWAFVSVTVCLGVGGFLSGSFSLLLPVSLSVSLSGSLGLAVPLIHFSLSPFFFF